MWRAEPNTFARARPAHLEAQYNTSAAPPSTLLLDGVGNKWFHVPDSSGSNSSSRRDAPGLPAGLVYSALHSSSALSTSPGTSAPHTALQRGRRGEEDVVDTDVSRLLRQYRDESARLREQLKAKALHEAHLIAKLEDMSRRYALLQLECQRASVNPAVSQLFASEDEATASAEVATRRRLSEQAEELQQLRLSVRELEGRVEAYRGALHRARAHHDTSAEDAVQEEDGGSGGPATLHTLLLESLHTADYLVKVCNAVQHFHNTRHESIGNGGCQRTRHECILRCLNAAVKGSVRPPELRDVTAGPENNTTAANTEAAVAVREELLYCETVAVRLAAALLAQTNEATTSVVSSAASSDGEGDVPVQERGTSVPAEDALAQPQREGAPVVPGASPDFGGIAAHVPRTKQPRCRPDLEDCEVQ